MLNVNPGDLQRGVGNMFATNLEGATLLAGLVGCDTYTIDNGIPYFSGDTERLEFVVGGPFGMIGRYTRKYECPTYRVQGASTTIYASGLAGGAAFYSVREDTPLMPYLLTVMDGKVLLSDLRVASCICGHEVELTQDDRVGLKLPALAMLAADSPRNPCVFPSESAFIFESTTVLTGRCAIGVNMIGSPRRVYAEFRSSWWPCSEYFRATICIGCVPW
jgi:hypothetical protein